ncbi:MAG: type II methionyl aminopeptidase [Candidatus Heimdallarchaeaceae archaeon]
MEKNEIDSYVKAGEIAKEIKSFAAGLIKPGMKLIDIAEGIDAKIFELGGELAFPVNLSMNEIAAHYTPAPGDETVAEGLLKIDVGVAVNGYIADTAFSMDLTEDNRYKEMMELNEKLLAAATKVVKTGMEVRDVGEAVQNTLEKWNKDNDSSFAVIKSLCGHSLARDRIHAGLTISNYRNDNKTELDDMAFAIEPFVTTGVGDIYEGRPGGIYVLNSDGRVRDRDAREVLKFIKKNYKTRPFCLRWLAAAAEVSGVRCQVSGMTYNKIKFVISILVKQGVLHEYSLLIEKSKAPVSQFENTFVVSGDGKVVCTSA